MYIYITVYHSARNYRFYRNGNFYKGTKFAKLLMERKLTTVRYHKKVHWYFFCMDVTANCCVFQVLCYGAIMLMGAFRLCIVTYIIALLTRARSKLSSWLSYLCSTSKKIVTVFGFLHFLLLLYFFASQLIGQPSVLNNRRRRHILTTNNDSI